MRYLPALCLVVATAGCHHTVVVPPVPRPLSITVRVTGPTGDPVAGATAKLQNGLPSVYSTCLTDGTGQCIAQVPAQVRNSGLGIDAPAEFQSVPDFPVVLAPDATLSVTLHRRKPTREEVRRVRGRFSPDIWLFDQWHAQYDEETFQRSIALHKAAGDTHVLIGLQSGGYHQLPPFDFFDNPQVVIDRAQRLKDAGFIVTWMLEDDASISNNPEGQRAAAMIRRWRQVADAIRPHVDMCLAGFEFNEYFTPQEQDMLLREMARLFPDAYRLVTFTDDRWIAGNGGGGPESPLPESWQGAYFGFWGAMKGIVHGLAFQAPFEYIDSAENNHYLLRHRLGMLAIRINGARQDWDGWVNADFDSKYPAGPAGDFDLVYWEGPCQWTIRGEKSHDWADTAGRDALTVPGVIGAGDGWKR